VNQDHRVWNLKNKDNLVIQIRYQIRFKAHIFQEEKLKMKWKYKVHKVNLNQVVYI